MSNSITTAIRKAKNWEVIETREQYLLFREWIDKLSKCCYTASDDITGKEPRGPLPPSCEFPPKFKLTLTEVIQVCADMKVAHEELETIFENEVRPTYPKWFDHEGDPSSTFNALGNLKYAIKKLDENLRRFA
tara:strand:- start:2504 stop:2902 length:399 start_codon:yes stop_codon:yes gene_type:complete